MICHASDQNRNSIHIVKLLYCVVCAELSDINSYESNVFNIVYSDSVVCLESETDSMTETNSIHRVDDEVSFRVNNHAGMINNSAHESPHTLNELLPNNNNVGTDRHEEASLEAGDRLGSMEGISRELKSELCELVKNVVREELQRPRCPPAAHSDEIRSPVVDSVAAEGRPRSARSSWPRYGEYRHPSEGRSQSRRMQDSISPRGLYEHDSFRGQNRDNGQFHDWQPRRPRYEGGPHYAREDLSIKVRSYDPKEVDWLTYKGHFEAVANQAAWSARTSCARLMSALPGSLTGVVAGLPEPIRYVDLVARLDAIHGISNSREDAILKLGSCRKEGDENIPLFAERVRQLVERAYPDFSNVGKEEQALRIFLQGLPARHDMRLHMRMKSFRSLREASEYGARLEQVIKDEKFQENRRPIISRSAADTHGEYDEVLVRLCNDISQVKTNQEKCYNSVKSFQDKLVDRSDAGDGKKQVKSKDGKAVATGGTAKGKQRTKENSPCFFCSEMGHWKNECPHRAKVGSPKSDKKSLNC